VGEVYDDAERGPGFWARVWRGGGVFWVCVSGVDGGV